MCVCSIYLSAIFCSFQSVRLYFILFFDTFVSEIIFLIFDVFCLLCISLVQSLSRVQLFVTPWTAVRQASLFITNSWSLLTFVSIELVMPSNHLILCCPLLFCLQFFPASGSFPVSSSFHQVANVLEFQLHHQSFQWIFRTDLL